MEEDRKRLEALIHILAPQLDRRWAEVTSEKKDKEKKKKKTTTRRNPRNTLPASAVAAAPPEMPEAMRLRIEEMIGNNKEKKKHGPFWLGLKELEESDVIAQKNRLFLPNNQKFPELLTKKERESLIVNKKKGKCGGKRTWIVDGSGKCTEVDFKIWESLSKYVLSNEWIKFVKDLGLRPKDLAQIWCFRDDNWQFCFAINIIFQQRKKGEEVIGSDVKQAPTGCNNNGASTSGTK